MFIADKILNTRVGRDLTRYLRLSELFSRFISSLIGIVVLTTIILQKCFLTQFGVAVGNFARISGACEGSR